MPPFITSKLQQAARFPVKKTMMIAQQLYEGIELPGEGAVGLITYMRTDSTRVSEQALDRRPRVHRREVRRRTTCRRSRTSTRRRRTRRTRTKRSVRRRCSTIPETVRAHLTPDQYYLYRLIWNRFVASQMPPATFDETTVDIARPADYLFRVKGSVPKFAGWLAVYNQETGRGPHRGARPRRRSDARTRKAVERAAARSAKGDALELKELKPEQKFTQPPPRYSEATLVKALEENGIGRPSTYASIIGVIQARDYVNKIEGRFKPTVLGRDAGREAAQPGVRRHPRRRATRASSKRSSTRSRKARRTTRRRSRASTRSSRRT